MRQRIICECVHMRDIDDLIMLSDQEKPVAAPCDITLPPGRIRGTSMARRCAARRLSTLDHARRRGHRLANALPTAPAGVSIFTVPGASRPAN